MALSIMMASDFKDASYHIAPHFGTHTPGEAIWCLRLQVARLKIVGNSAIAVAESFGRLRARKLHC